MTTVAPYSASNRAVAAPSPEAPPVTMAEVPPSSMSEEPILGPHSERRRCNVGAFAHWCLRHRKLVVTAWILAFFGLLLISRAVGTNYSSNFQLPKTESTKAIDLLQDTFPEQSGESDQIVVHTPSGSLQEPQVKQRLSDMFNHVARLPHVRAITSPYNAPGQLSQDGQTAFATVHFDNTGNALDKDAVKRVVSIAEGARQPGLQVELGGEAIEDTQRKGFGAIEAVGIGAAAIVLFIAFGSLLAM